MTAVAVELLSRPPERTTRPRPARWRTRPDAVGSSPTPIGWSRCAREARAATTRTDATAAQPGGDPAQPGPLGHDVRSIVEQRIAWEDLPGR